MVAQNGFIAAIFALKLSFSSFKQFTYGLLHLKTSHA